MTIQKYDQGFGFFGPMEKCKDGKWCKSEEADKEIESIRRLNGALIDMWDKSIRREICYDYRRSGAAVLAVVGWGVIAVGLVRYAFTGAVL